MKSKSPMAIHRYLKYAIGEIILVVIGILIALQINDWNAQRKDSAEEKAILKHLHENLILAKKQSKRLIAEEQTLKTRLIRILGIDSSKNENHISQIPDSIFVSAVWDLQSDQPTFNAYNNLKNTNKLSLIKNLKINEKFTDFEFQLDKLNDLLDDRLRVHQIRVDDILENEINFISLIKSNIQNINISDEPKNNFEDILKKGRVRNLLGMKLTFTQDIIEYRENLDNAISDLIALIDRELKTSKQ